MNKKSKVNREKKKEKKESIKQNILLSTDTEPSSPKTNIFLLTKRKSLRERRRKIIKPFVYNSVIEYIAAVCPLQHTGARRS